MKNLPRELTEPAQAIYYRKENPTFSLQSVEEITKIVEKAKVPPPVSRSIGGFGWGGDLNLEYIFEKLFCEPAGQGYPRERAVPEKRNKKILDEVKKVTYRDFCDILADLVKYDAELVKGAFAGEHFKEYFLRDAKDQKVVEAVKKIIG